MTKTAPEVAGEAYQVIGALADAAGLSGTPAVQAALDYFSSDLTDEILPFVASASVANRNVPDGGAS